MTILGCFGGTTILGNTQMDANGEEKHVGPFGPEISFEITEIMQWTLTACQRKTTNHHPYAPYSGIFTY